MAVSLYQLAEELGVSPKSLQRWLKSKGLGAKKSLTRRAADEARAHFKEPADHPMAHALAVTSRQSEVARHEELTLNSNVKVEERPKLKWERVKRDDTDITRMDMKQQRDLFKNLRHAGASTDEGDQVERPPSAREIKANMTQEETRSQTSHAQTSHAQTSHAQPSRAQPSRVQPSRAQRPARRPTANAEHAVFGSLASLAGSLDSMAERPQARAVYDPKAEEEAARLFREGATPLIHKSNTRSSQESARAKSSRADARVSSSHESESKSVSKNVSKRASKRAGKRASKRDLQRGETSASGEFQELFEHPVQQSLQDRLNATHSLLKAVIHERDALRVELNRAQAEQSAPIARPVSAPHAGRAEERAGEETGDEAQSINSAGQLIWDQLHARGLNASQAIHALTRLLEHPRRGPELIYSFRSAHVDPIDRGFSIVCNDAVCREVAHDRSRLGLIKLETRHLCSVCQGSDARAWYQRLLIAARDLGHESVLVVGGDDAHYAQLRELERQHPALSWDFIAGGSRLNQTVANAKVGHKAAVVLWGGLYLPHALSNLVKAAADRADVPCFSVEPGTRSVAALCREILRSWGVDYEA